MSLKNALMGFKKQLEDKATDEKVAKMLAEQSDILNKNVVKQSSPKKWFDESVLSNGGNTHYKLNDKWYRVSVCDGDNDIILKFRFKDAIGRWVSVSARSLKEAQQVIDSIYGTSKDGKHKYTLSACRV